MVSAAAGPAAAPATGGSGVLGVASGALPGPPCLSRAMLSAPSAASMMTAARWPVVPNGRLASAETVPVRRSVDSAAAAAILAAAPRADLNTAAKAAAAAGRCASVSAQTGGRSLEMSRNSFLVASSLLFFFSATRSRSRSRDLSSAKAVSTAESWSEKSRSDPSRARPGPWYRSSARSPRISCRTPTIPAFMAARVARTESVTAARTTAHASATARGERRVSWHSIRTSPSNPSSMRSSVSDDLQPTQSRARSAVAAAAAEDATAACLPPRLATSAKLPISSGRRIIATAADTPPAPTMAARMSANACGVAPGETPFSGGPCATARSMRATSVCASAVASGRPRSETTKTLSRATSSVEREIADLSHDSRVIGGGRCEGINTRAPSRLALTPPPRYSGPFWKLSPPSPPPPRGSYSRRASVPPHAIGDGGFVVAPRLPPPREPKSRWVPRVGVTRVAGRKVLSNASMWNAGGAIPLWKRSCCG
mmetsp:Transcript_24358/g.60577  ORF Transcript_24358/g.60577 Transcript_24358/m.60577 type:complete len:484 (+) Transcript_24358:982-2433(+)